MTHSADIEKTVVDTLVPAPWLKRVIVVGTSGTGKTAFARRLADALGYSAIELDDLYWGPEWKPKPDEEFRRLVRVATDRPRWVADGNYSVIRDILWPRATGVIWLNYSFSTTLLRALRRSIVRIVHREKLFAGNHESFARTFLSRHSILIWIATTYHRRRRDYTALRSSKKFAQLQWLEFRRSSEAEAFLRSVQTAGDSPHGGA